MKNKGVKEFHTLARARFADFAQAPCGKFNKFGLFLEDQKILTGFYNGGL